MNSSDVDPELPDIAQSLRNEGVATMAVGIPDGGSKEQKTDELRVSIQLFVYSYSAFSFGTVFFVVVVKNDIFVRYL